MVATVTFFGTSAASPSVERGFSCIGVSEKHVSDSLLLDCGDGSIRNIVKCGGDLGAISGILITHHHSDHLTGLTQVIETMGIRKRKSDLTVFGPPGLREYFSTVQKVTAVASKREFRVDIVELVAGQSLHFHGYNFTTFEMDHTLPCLGYRLASPVSGKVISYTGDTMPCETEKDLGREADLFIHEATFLQKDVEKARPPKHSTPLDAAAVAKSANSKKLILTHVSDDYEKPNDMILEAEGLFSNTIVASDGLTLEV